MLVQQAVVVRSASADVDASEELVRCLNNGLQAQILPEGEFMSSEGAHDLPFLEAKNCFRNCRDDPASVIQQPASVRTRARARVL
jgi:hypothetical protein